VRFTVLVIRRELKSLYFGIFDFHVFLSVWGDWHYEEFLSTGSTSETVYY
jgi:hypothetical protein